jgi:hypothetical protein
MTGSDPRAALSVSRRTIAVVVVIVLAALAAGHLYDLRALSVPAGLLVTLVLPGALAVRALHLDADPVPAIARSLGLSLVASTATGLVLGALPVGTTVAAVTWVMAALVAVLTVPAVLATDPRPPRATALQGPAPGPSAGSAPRPSTPPSSVPGLDRLAAVPGRRLAAGLGAAVVTVVALGAAASIAISSEEAALAAPMTQVVLLPESLTSPSTTTELSSDVGPTFDDRRSYTLGITNREGDAVTYEVTFAIEGEEPTNRVVALADGDTWTAQVEAGFEQLVSAVVTGAPSGPAGGIVVRANGT